MKSIALLFLLLGIFSLPSSTQTPPASNPPDVPTMLQKIEQTAQTASLDLARLRIDKWKADSPVKSQAQSNADSLSRNLTTALPGLISAVRTSPQNMAANFKLYRNLNALYDVFEGLAESTGAFGSKQEFESLSRHVQDIDTYRRSFGDYMEQLAVTKDAELAKAKSAAAQPAQAVHPKKIIVDNEPAPKSAKKKK